MKYRRSLWTVAVVLALLVTVFTPTVAAQSTPQHCVGHETLWSTEEPVTIWISQGPTTVKDGRITTETFIAIGRSLNSSGGVPDAQNLFRNPLEAAMEYETDCGPLSSLDGVSSNGTGGNGTATSDAVGDVTAGGNFNNTSGNLNDSGGNSSYETVSGDAAASGIDE
ncbi:MAG: hypothetical protein ABEK59_05830 [Halobacteria archaeon]